MELESSILSEVTGPERQTLHVLLLLNLDRVYVCMDLGGGKGQWRAGRRGS